MKIVIGSDHRGVEVKRRLIEVVRSMGHDILGIGTGMCMAANKVRGVRAAACQDVLTTEMSRRHNDANVLCLSADLLGEDQMMQMIRIWLDTPFEGGRHARRIEKIAKIEEEQCKPQ